MQPDCFFVVQRTAAETRLRLRRGYLAIHRHELSSLISPSFFLILFLPAMGISYLIERKHVQFVDLFLSNLALAMFLFFVFTVMNIVSYILPSFGWKLTINPSASGNPRSLVVSYLGKQIQAPSTICLSTVLESGDPENGIGGNLCAEIELTSGQDLSGTSLRIRTPPHSTQQRQRVEAEGKQLSDWLEHELGLTRTHKKDEGQSGAV